MTKTPTETIEKNAYPHTLEMSMLAIQSELTNPIKDATNPHFKAKYATLPEIRNLITPVLAKYGLYVTQVTDLTPEGNLTVATTIVHAPSKERFTPQMPLLLDKQTSQAQGSAITYARRYALCAMLNIAADEDDDGNAASSVRTNRSDVKSKEELKKDSVPKAAENKPLSDEVFNEYHDAIGNAQTLDELKTVFERAQKAANEAVDNIAKQGFAKAKDKRKSELEQEKK